MNKLKKTCIHLTIENQNNCKFLYINDEKEFYMVIKYVNEHESNVSLGWDGGKRYNFMQN